MSGVSRLADPRRAPRPDDVGTPPESGVEHCHGGLPGLRWGGAEHCLHRGNRGDRENPYPPRCETRRARRGCSPEPAPPNEHRPALQRRGARLRWRLMAGAAGKSPSADGWLGGFGRWNAGQSHSAGQIDDPAVARTSARRWFRLTRRGFMLLIPNCTKSGLVRSPVLRSIAVSRLVLSRQLILFSAVLPDAREFLFVIEQ